MTAKVFVKTKDDGAVQGPFSSQQIKKLAAQGKLKPHHLLSKNRQTWQRASAVKGLAFPAQQEAKEQVEPARIAQVRTDGPGQTIVEGDEVTEAVEDNETVESDEVELPHIEELRADDPWGAILEGEEPTEAVEDGEIVEGDEVELPHIEELCADDPWGAILGGEDATDAVEDSEIVEGDEVEIVGAGDDEVSANLAVSDLDEPIQEAATEESESESGGSLEDLLAGVGCASIPLTYIGCYCGWQLTNISGWYWFGVPTLVFVAIAAIAAVVAIIVSVVRRRRQKARDDARIAEVNASADDAFIVEVAKTDPSDRVRDAAISRIESMDVLMDLIHDRQMPSKHRQAAVFRVNDQTLLADIAKGAPRDIAITAVNQIKDQALLPDIAKNAPYNGIALAAIEKIEDQTLLADIAEHAPNKTVGTAAVDKTDDQALLAVIAEHAPNQTVAIAAVDKTEDRALLEKIAKCAENDSVRKTAGEKASRMVLFDEIAELDPESRKRSVGELTDQILLSRILVEDEDASVRAQAAKSLTRDTTNKMFISEARQNPDRLRTFLTALDAAGAVKRIDCWKYALRNAIGSDDGYVLRLLLSKRPHMISTDLTWAILDGEVHKLSDRCRTTLLGEKRHLAEYSDGGILAWQTLEAQKANPYRWKECKSDPTIKLISEILSGAEHLDDIAKVADGVKTRVLQRIEEQPHNTTPSPALTENERMARKAICDICRTDVPDGGGYVLRTREVVTEVGYWRKAFSGASTAVGEMSEEQVQKQFANQVSQMCAQYTGWLTCQECIGVFSNVDRQAAQSYAQEYWSCEGEAEYAPPDGDAVAVSEALPMANTAWKECTGREPPGDIKKEGRPGLKKAERRAEEREKWEREKHEALEAKERPMIDENDPRCPKCGGRLKTPKARQCLHCGADWHAGPLG